MHQFSAQQDTIGFFTILVSNTVMAKQDNYSRYTIRVPQDVYAAIEDAASEANRSVNAEIVHRLTRSLNAYGAGHLWLELPTEVWNNLLIDANAHKQMIEERAAAILSGAHDADHTLVLDKMSEVLEKNATLEDEISELKAQEGIDFVLYYNKSVQTGVFARQIASLPEGIIPDQLRQNANEIAQLAEAETKTLQMRYQTIQLSLRQRENVHADDAE